MLNEQEAEAVVSLALMAALADGRTDPDEREQIKSLFETLSAEGDLASMSQVHQRVVLRQTTPEVEAAKLESDEAKQMAFEIAVCVADADGRVTPTEQAFLDRLESLVGLDHNAAIAFETQAQSIAETGVPTRDRPMDASALLGPIEIEERHEAPLAVTPPVPVPTEESHAPATGDARAREVDETILKYAVLNGALELLPQNLATMAILPLQTRMVYAIGKTYGHSLGAGHIKEFIATLGLGATSQMLENFARKALGKLAKKALGKTAGKMVKTTTGPMMSFASTYAIGKVAEAYYAGGRTLSSVDLRSLFQRDLARGKSLFAQHRPQVERSATTIRPDAVLDMVRGKLR